MNDAFRGAIIVGALTAIYLAFRIAFVYLRHWRKDRRRWVMSHVFYLALSLVVTTGIVIYTIANVTGTNADLTWWEGARLAQVTLICVGLRPLWAHHRSMTQKRIDQT